MPMNRIQFQHGMSLREFVVCYGTEAKCAWALVAQLRISAIVDDGAGAQVIF